MRRPRTIPFYDNGGVRDDGSMLPVLTRDAVRLAAIGENLAVALRTGRNAVVAYRFDYTEATSYTRIWRTLVEPGLTMFAAWYYLGQLRRIRRAGKSLACPRRCRCGG